MYKTIKFEENNGIGTLTISRPEALNALNSDVLKELDNFFSEVEKNENLRVLIITGEGRSFVAGADIAEMAKLNEAEAKEFGEIGNTVMNKIENSKFPTIAKVNGFALGGGCELSMACDIRIASSKAKFGQPEVGLGITPGFGGTQRLSKLIGKGNAKLLIYTADVIDANKAFELGLVQKVVEPEELDNEVLKLAEKIKSKAPIAISLSKEAINLGYTENMEEGKNIEVKAFSKCFSTTDQKNGMKAFLEKTKFEFENK